MKKINLQKKIASLTILKQLYPNTISRDKLIKEFKNHDIPVSPIYLAAYAKVGVISINNSTALIKNPDLLDKAYEYLNKDVEKVDKTKKLNECKKYLENAGYVVIKKSSNTQILVCSKIY